MSTAKDFWIVRSNHITEGWIYSDAHGAEKRLGSGLKAPPLEWEYEIIQVREVLDTDRLFSEVKEAHVSKLDHKLAVASNLIEKLEIALRTLKVAVNDKQPDIGATNFVGLQIALIEEWKAKL